MSPIIENSVDCVPFTDPFIFWAWVEPAQTKEECLAQVQTRYGCQIFSRREDTLLWILDEEQCNCHGLFLKDDFLFFFF